MTTTLRPAGPERHAAAGERSRQYTVCVNGRPVGRVRVGTGPRFGPGRGPGPGRIEGLAVDEPDRRRGRGTVAVLAAEEILRSWGCARVEISVPEDATHALRIAAALGYTERQRALRKALPPGVARHGLPPGSTLRPLGADERRAWLLRDRADFVAGLIASGVPPAEAEARAAAAFAQLLPEVAGPSRTSVPEPSALAGPSRTTALAGLSRTSVPEPSDAAAPSLPRPSAGVQPSGVSAPEPSGAAVPPAQDAPGSGGTSDGVLLALVHEGAPVGRLWLRTSAGAGWVAAVEVDPGARGRGHGRTLMLAAEDASRDGGADSLALNVLTANTPAVRLYTSLGYRTTRRLLYKPLL